MSSDEAELQSVTRAHHIEDLVVGDLLQDLVPLGVLEEAHTVVGHRAEKIMVHMGCKESGLVALADARTSLTYYIIVILTLGFIEFV